MSAEENQPPQQQGHQASAMGGGEISSAEGGAKTKQLEAAYYSVVSHTTPDGRIIFGQDIEIFPNKPLVNMASPGTTAFEAKDRRLTTEQFAVLCGRGTIPRVTIIGSYKNLKNPHLLKLIDAGIVNWTPENGQRFTLIFERPFGRKVLESLEAKPIKMAEDKLIPSVIQPVVSVLSDLRNIDLIHGAINPMNTYLTGGEGMESVIIGECLSNAPSTQQHAMFEKVSRAMAQQSGRGPGTIKDDLYALGVMVAMMARGENFMAGKTQQQIVHEKIEHGSYGSIMGRERMPGGISEFLRGVLNDDEDQRWDIDDAVRWLEGRRLSPKQSRVILRAARPFVFRDQKYWDLRSVSESFAEHITEAAVELEKEQFDQWIKRNFEDKALKMRLERVWATEKTSAREKLVASICMVLDPWGPIRFKRLSIFPTGYGTALAEAVARGEDIQPYGEMLANQLFTHWLAQISDEIPDAGGLAALFEKCRGALAQKIPGYGMERVLYIMNPEVICLSPTLRDYYVLVPGSLLLALEAIAKQSQRPTHILDRHMVAFISVREPKMIDPHLGYVNSRDEGSQMIGIIRTLGAIQRRFSIGAVPGICNWLISMTGPVIEMLNDHDLRAEVTKGVNRLVDSGNLKALLELIDDPLMVQDDKRRFALARYEYRALMVEKEEIEGYLKKRKFFGRTTGRQVAMIISSILSTIIIVGYVAMRVTKGI